jgi:hypothetical protein
MCMYFLVYTYIIHTACFTYIHIQTCRIADAGDDPAGLQVRLDWCASRVLTGAAGEGLVPRLANPCRDGRARRRAC